MPKTYNLVTVKDRNEFYLCDTFYINYMLIPLKLG